MAAGKPEAADAEASHVGGEQDSEGYGCGADGELQHLIPDDFVNERGASAGGEENQQDREERVRFGRGVDYGLRCDGRGGAQKDVLRTDKANTVRNSRNVNDHEPGGAGG